MKTLSMTIALLLGVMFASAQNLNSKNGTPILPEAGDYSIGMDAVPVLNYFGNLLNSASNTAAIGYQQDATLVGSYRKTATKAYRGKLAINYTDTKVADNETSGMGVTLGAGLANYRGKGRLQGYYGAELGLGISNTKTTTAGVETKTDGFGINARGFVGAEYFFAPKMSVGAEYGWGPNYAKVGDDTSLNLGVDNGGGAINLSLYF